MQLSLPASASVRLLRYQTHTRLWGRKPGWSTSGFCFEEVSVKRQSKFETGLLNLPASASIRLRRYRMPTWLWIRRLRWSISGFHFAEKVLSSRRCRVERTDRIMNMLTTAFGLPQHENSFQAVACLISKAKTKSDSIQSKVDSLQVLYCAERRSKTT